MKNEKCTNCAGPGLVPEMWGAVWTGEMVCCGQPKQPEPKLETKPETKERDAKPPNGFKFPGWFVLLLLPVFLQAQAPVMYAGGAMAAPDTVTDDTYAPLIQKFGFDLSGYDFQTIAPFTRRYALSDHVTVTIYAKEGKIERADSKCPLPLDPKKFCTCIWIYHE
jgi:hypothetical protein